MAYPSQKMHKSGTLRNVFKRYWYMLYSPRAPLVLIRDHGKSSTTILENNNAFLPSYSF